MSKAREIADKMIDQYQKAELDGVYLAGNQFKSVMAPNLVLRKFMPVEVPEDEKRRTRKTLRKKGATDLDYIYEQPPEEFLAGCFRGTWRWIFIAPCSNRIRPNKLRA